MLRGCRFQPHCVEIPVGSSSPQRTIEIALCRTPKGKRSWRCPGAEWIPGPCLTAFVSRKAASLSGPALTMRPFGPRSASQGSGSVHGRDEIEWTGKCSLYPARCFSMPIAGRKQTPRPSSLDRTSCYIARRNFPLPSFAPKPLAAALLGSHWPKRNNSLSWSLRPREQVRAAPRRST